MRDNTREKEFNSHTAEGRNVSSSDFGFGFCLENAVFVRLFYAILLFNQEDTRGTEILIKRRTTMLCSTRETRGSAVVYFPNKLKVPVVKQRRSDRP
jgi:hypothetical protein